MPEPEEDLTPYPSQAQADEMVKAAILTTPLGQPRLVAREGDDLTPVMTQAQNDVAKLIACGPPPESLPPVNKDVPAVGPTTVGVGDTLTCTMGNWSGQPTAYSYAWSAAGAADAATYVVQAADAGTSISCVVTATNGNGSTAAPASNAVAINGATATASRRRG